MRPRRGISPPARFAVDDSLRWPEGGAFLLGQRLRRGFRAIRPRQRWGERERARREGLPGHSRFLPLAGLSDSGAIRNYSVVLDDVNFLVCIAAATPRYAPPLPRLGSLSAPVVVQPHPATARDALPIEV